MGTGETGTPTKASKVLAMQQAICQQKALLERDSMDQQITPTSYPEWAAAFQAYYNSGGQPPPGYFPPQVVSGTQPHAYLWGGQGMIPPYGTPAYGAVYPHAGMYAHPSISTGPHPYNHFGIPSPVRGNEATISRSQPTAGGDVDMTRGSEGIKDHCPSKTSKGSVGPGMPTVKADCGKGNSGSANGVFSHSSGESGSEGSSEGSDENSQNRLVEWHFKNQAINQIIAATYTSVRRER